MILPDWAAAFYARQQERHTQCVRLAATLHCAPEDIAYTVSRYGYDFETCCALLAGGYLQVEREPKGDGDGQ